MSVQQTEARELLTDVVSIQSYSGEEAEATERLVEFLEAHDREAWIDEVGNVRAPADDSVLLTSHVDTVPGDIPDAVVNGEPSGWDGVTLGYRGMLSGTYVATSESGHSSRPENNAIQDAMDWWRRVEDAVAADEWEPVFERVTTKPVSFSGGTSADGLSVEATMEVQFRVPPSMTPGGMREIADGELDVGTVRWKDAIPPTMQSPRTGPARAFRAAIRELGGEPRQLRKTGTSDMNLYAEAWDCPMVTYGPGDSSLDHTPTERLELAEFDRAVDVLTNVCARLL